MKTLQFQTRDEWRDWLAENHDQETEVWLIYYKKETGLPSLEYGESVEEALCFGWVDSIIKKIDEEKYVRKFTPRKVDSKWSALNKKRVAKMIKANRMTEHGLKLIDAAKKLDTWDAPTEKPKFNLEMTDAFANALQSNPKAKAFFNSLAPTYQKQYLLWIATAKLDQTKQKRIDESIKLLNEGEKLGLR